MQNLETVMLCCLLVVRVTHRKEILRSQRHATEYALLCFMQGRLLHINDGANAPWKK